MAAPLLPPASTTRRGVNPSAFMGSSFAAGSNLAEKVAGNTKDIVVLKGAIIKLEKDDEEKEDKSSDANLVDRLDNIAASLGVLTRVLKADLKSNKTQAQQEEKDRVRTQRREREAGLEKKGGQVLSGVAKTVTKPFRGFFDHIFNFFKQILLGSALLGLVKWLKDPANQDKIAAFSKFMTETFPEVMGKTIDHVRKNWKIYAAIAGALVVLNLAGIVAGLKVVWGVLSAIGGFLFSMKGAFLMLPVVLSGSSRRREGLGTAEDFYYKFLPKDMIGPDGAWDKFISAKMQPFMPELIKIRREKGDKAADKLRAELEARFRNEFILANPELKNRPGAEQFLNPDKLADGGRPVVGKVALVGERGPELFIPDVPGTVVPNHMIGKNLKSSSIDRPMIPNKTQVIDLSGGQPQQQTGNSTEGGETLPNFSSRSGDGSLASVTELGVLNV